MAVMTRDAWTDDRLDDLNKRVDEGFTDMRTEFRTLRTDFGMLRGEAREESVATRTDLGEEISSTRSELKEEIGSVRSELKEEIAGVRLELSEIRREIGALNRTIHQFAFAMVGTVFLGFCGTIAALISLT